MADKFFAYYDSVFQEGAFSKREKALIALAAQARRKRRTAGGGFQVSRFVTKPFLRTLTNTTLTLIFEKRSL